MKILITVMLMLASTLSADVVSKVSEKQWFHGSDDCSKNTEPALDILEVNMDTYILRQNKCLDAEAPFIYLMFGNDTLFIQDTGATEDADRFPLYQTIQGIIKNRAENNPDVSSEVNILVTHSHGHGDHKAADSQFIGKPNVTIIDTYVSAISAYFNLQNWPDGESQVELGNRKLTVFAIPGHHDQSIAVFDPMTGWLLTGDTFYPGRLYVKDWSLFKDSIQKLADFSNKHPVTALMGTHIEMSQDAGKDFPVGTTYQPNELPLPLTIEDLSLLNKTLITMADPEEKVLDKFIIAPVGMMQKIIGGVLGWFVS